MSLKLPQKKGLPVLDSPSGFTGPKTFLTRRPLSVVGKPVLAEKHLPVRPSASLMARKCYCNDSEYLFRFRRKTAGNRKFRPCGTVDPDPWLPFETRAVWTDEFPRQSLLQRPMFQCFDDAASPPRNTTGPMVGSAGFSNRTPSCMQVAVCRLQAGRHYARKPDTDFKFISDGTLRLCQIAKLPGEQISSTFDSFLSVLNAKKRSRKFACVSPVLKTFADYLTAPTVFLDGMCKRQSLPIKTPPPEAEGADFSMLTQLNRSVSLPVFSAKFEFSPEKRIIEHEKHENFVLEHKAVFSPGFSRKTICLTYNQTFTRACPEKQRSFDNQPGQILPATPAAISARPAGRIAVVNNPAFILLHSGAVPQKGRIQPADSGLFATPRRDPRFRLRLRLQRQSFPATSLPFATIQPEPDLDLIRITNRRIPANFDRMKIKTLYTGSFSVQSAFKKVCVQADYRPKKASFMVRAAKHARYTLLQLRNIIVPAKNKTLPFPGLIFPAFAKSEPRRDKSLVKSCPELMIARSSIKFSHREVALDFLGQNQAFTAISTGTMPRRIKPATPQPLPDMRLESSPKRRKTMRQLRFKLHSINEGFVSSKLRPQKKIEKETSFFLPADLGRKSLPAAENERFTALKSFRQPRLKHKLRLRRFALQQVLPAQISAQLHLDMKICSAADKAKMPVRHFIVPALGAKNLRHFNCRISLLPHPFGFPVFSFSEPRFYSLIAKPVFAQHQPQTSNLHCTGSFIIKKDQLFLPPLSMKNPRRLLYSYLNPALANKEFYLAGNLAIKGAICQAPRIADFLHTWLGSPGGCVTPRSEEKYNQRLRLKQPQIKHLPETGKKLSYCPKICDTSVPRMNRINRLLLRARRFSAAVTKSSIEGEMLPITKLFRPCLYVPDTASAAWHEPQSRFSIFSCEISQLQQKPVFNDDVAESFRSQFHARFRSFRFPWRPEIKMSPRGMEQPWQPDTGVSATAIALPDELRSTAFIFADAGANILHLPSRFLQDQVARIRHLSAIKQSAIIERRFTVTEAICQTMRLQNPEKYLQQFINPETFFVMREKNRSRLKKNLRNYSFRNASKTIQLRPDSEKFSEFGLKNRAVRRMPLEPLHWIIMMHSFLQPESPAMNYCVNLPGAVNRYRRAMQASVSLPGLDFSENRHAKLPALESGLKISSWPIQTSDLKFSDLALPVPAKSEAKAFSLIHTGMPASENEKTVDRPLTEIFAPFNQPFHAWQPVHNLALHPIKTESENRFIETAMFKVEARPRHPHISIRHRPEEFKPAFIPEWIDQVWQRPGLQKR